jgi:hypothetical protein
VRYNHPYAATAFRAVAKVFGEAVRVEPMLPAGELKPAAPDPNRAQVTTRGVIALSPTVSDFEGVRQGRSIDTSARVAERRASVWFDLSDYAAIGYALKPGDRVVLVTRPGAPAYVVARDPVSSDRGDIHVHLVEKR